MRRHLIISVFWAISGLIVSASVGVAKQKTVEACVKEWRSDKANMQKKGVTEEAYVAECLGGATATPSAAPSAPATAAPAAPSAAAVAPVSPAPKGSSVPIPGELQFETARQAKDHCPTDTVVWANLASKAYHFYGSGRYGSTKRGAYMCEREALSVGMKPGKNEKHP